MGTFVSTVIFSGLTARLQSYRLQAVVVYVHVSYLIDYILMRLY